MRRFANMLRLALVAAVSLTTSAATPDASYRQFNDLRAKATAADRAGRFQDAKRFWEQAHALAPDAFTPTLALASIAGREGRTGDALALLEEGWTAGVWDPSSLEESDDLKSVRGDARWDTLLTKLKSEYEETHARLKQRQVDLDPKTASPFRSYKKLATAFDRRTSEFDKSRWRLSLKEIAAGYPPIRQERIAALHRYLVEHPQAHDRGDAAWNVIETRLWGRYVYDYHDRLRELGTQVLEEIDGFLRDYPSDPHAAQASLQRAFVAFATRPEGGTETHPWRDEDMAAFDHDLDQIATRFSGTTTGGLAIAWRLILADRNSPDRFTPEMLAIKAQLDEIYGHDQEVQRLLLQQGRAAVLRMEGLGAFDATDLAGTHWTTSSFKGRVTLIDFWATWCGPCVEEIPTLKRAWDEYHAKGLTILGVSLDSDDRSTFEGWLARNDVTWPQIWDGKGFSTPLARKFGIHAIPFAVLLDRDGKVAAAGLRGDELLSRIAKLLDAPREPNGSNAPSGE